MKQASALKQAPTASKKGAAPTQSTLNFGTAGKLGIKKVQEMPSSHSEEAADSKKRRREELIDPS